MNKPAFRRAITAVNEEFKEHRSHIEKMKHLGVSLDFRGESTLHTKRLEAIEAVVREYLDEAEVVDGSV